MLIMNRNRITALGFGLIPVYCLVLSIGFLAGCQTTAPSDTTMRQATAARNLGEAYLLQKNYTLALHEFLKAEKINPNDRFLQNDLGLTYMGKKRLDLAVKHFKIALDLRPDYAPARNNLGAAYMAQKDWDAAISTFKDVTNDLLYATPHYPLSNLGKAYYFKKEFASAEMYYKKALELEPEFVNALYGLGRTYLAMGQVSGAVGLFERTIAVAPRLAEAHLELAYAYRLSGETKKARDCFLRVLKLAPNTSQAADATAALETLR